MEAINTANSTAKAVSTPELKNLVLVFIFILLMTCCAYLRRPPPPPPRRPPPPPREPPTLEEPRDWLARASLPLVPLPPNALRFVPLGLFGTRWFPTRPAASASAGVAAARAIGHVAGSGTTAITHSTLLPVRYSGALLPISCTKISTALLPADVLPRIVLAIRQAIPTSRAAVLISQ